MNEYHNWPADKPIPEGWMLSPHTLPGHHARNGFVWIEPTPDAGPRLISYPNGTAHFVRAVNERHLTKGQVLVLLRDCAEAIERMEGPR
jgi:hypothetical protein